MAADPTATPEEETQVYKDVCQNLVPYVLLGRGDRQLETLMYDYVHADRRAVKNDQTKLVTFARDNVVQAENDVKVQKKIVADYHILKLNAKRELQDKKRKFLEIGNSKKQNGIASPSVTSRLIESCKSNEKSGGSMQCTEKGRETTTRVE